MNKNYKSEQNGRSMVEMLGVLAVIGVLSITGISGYTTAMNKHKANEILDAASKRAVAVSTQIQRGNTNPTLAEFEGEAVQGVTFGTPVKVGDNQFKLPVTWASDTAKTTIGAQIKNITGDGTGTVLVDSDVTRFLYNNDLSNGVANTNNRTGTDCDAGYTGVDCDSCKANYGMHDGSCVACSTVSATGTSSSVPATGYTGCYCTSDQTWENNECKSAGPVFKVLINSYTHAGAIAACAGIGSGWRLASGINDLGCSYGSDCRSILYGLTYEGYGWDVEYVWLSECYDDNKSDKVASSCSTNDSDFAWFIQADSGIINSNMRNGGLGTSSALCVKD